MTNPTGNINVFYSNRTEKLVEALAEHLNHTDAFGTVFDEPTILVPNWNLSRYLKFELSQRFGIASDYFSTVEELLAESVPDDVDFLDNHTLQSAILTLLRDEEFLQTETLRDVNRYLEQVEESEEQSRTARNVKLYQLSKRLARNFRQYSHSRIKMLGKWQDSSDYYTETDNYRTNEEWQRYIWNQLFNQDGSLRTGEDDGSALYLLPEYFRHVRPGELDLPRQIHIFGVSHFAPVYERIFGKLGEVTSVQFYVLNPCREFWEDVVYDEQEEILEDLQSRRDQAQELTSDSFDLDPESTSDSPFALRAWGRAGRDLIHMLNKLSGYHFDESWVDPTATGGETTLLEQFQHDVLNFEKPQPDPERWASDRSIQFLACRNKRREVEAVADQIWSLVMDEEETGPDSISFEDIAVIVNPRKREEYQSRIETVFDQVHDIPFNEIDITRSERSRLMEGIESLLSLPTEPAQRENILTLLTHPNFADRADEVDPEKLKQWVDNLGIFHGADRRDHEDTYLDRDIFNWDQGLRRLVLGYFMENVDDSDERLRFEIGEDTYRPEPVSETEVQSAGTLVESVRRLIATARSVREEHRSLTEWFNWMAEFIRTNLEPSHDAQEAEFKSYLNKLATLADVDRAPDAVEYETALQFALDELGKLESKPGNYLASGVVVSSFVPQRPIPFEAVFMLGMNEEDFPASSPRSPIDLHTEKWHDGDLWDRDRERYMFFETLLSIRQNVYLSWVAEDPVTGESIEPSSVLREFQQILREYVGEDQLEQLVVRHHLRRFNPRYFGANSTVQISSEDEDRAGRPAEGPTFNPEAIAEAKVQRLRNELLDREDWASTRELSTRQLPENVSGLLRSISWPEAPERPEDSDEEEHPRQLKIKALEKYFRSPLQAWASYALGLTQEDDETLIDKNTEPFETNRLWGTVLPRDTYETAALRNGTVPDEAELHRIYSDEKVALQEKGNAPAGLFGDVQETKHEDLLEGWQETIADYDPEVLTRYRFGSSGSVENVQTETPLKIPVQESSLEPEHVDLIGDTELFDPEHNVFYTFATDAKTYKYLRGYLSGIMLMAAGIIEDDTFNVVIVTGDGAQNKEFSWNIVKDPMEYLSDRITELLTEDHDYRLPLDVCEDFLDNHGAESEKSFEQRVREADADDYHTTQDEYGPLDNIEEYRTKGAGRDDASRMIEILQRERLKPFWCAYFEKAWGEILHGEEVL